MKKYCWVLAALLLVLLGFCCATERPEVRQDVSFLRNDFVILEVKSTRSKEYNWGGQEYIGMFFRQGEDYYLTSSIPDYTDGSSPHFVKYLGQNVVMISHGLAVENGRLVAEYFNAYPKDDDPRNDKCGEWKKASVPFGDFYGREHVSVPLPENIPLEEEYSKKYGVGGFFKLNEPAIESLIPKLKTYIRTNDSAAFADLILYPMYSGFVDSKGQGIWLENADDFIKYYPRIFSSHTLNELLNLADDDLFCNWQGLMINNRIWLFGRTNGKIYFKKL